MSELKATPGPWAIRCTGPHWNNPELANIEINYGEDTECVCDTVYEMNDAHLIATAPDLYQRLKELHEGMLFDNEYMASQHCGDIEKLLAKARGES